MAEPEKARTSKATGGNTAAHVAFVDSFQAKQSRTAPDFTKYNLNKYHTRKGTDIL